MRTQIATRNYQRFFIQLPKRFDQVYVAAIMHIEYHLE
jgi:hypothetical protein